MIKRNSAMSDVKPVFTSESRGHQRHRYTLAVGSKWRTVVDGGNKRDGRQHAAQKMLKLLYPDASTWGDIMRMYAVDALSM